MLNLNIEEKENGLPFLQSNNAKLKISLFPLLTGKISLKNIFSDNININIKRDNNGVFNIEKIFPKKENGFFKLSLNNSIININNSILSFTDEQLDKSAKITSNPITIKTDSKKKEIYANIQSKLIANNGEESDFDINLNLGYPLKKELGTNIIDGNFIAYNVDLALFKPFIQKYCLYI